MSNEKLEYQKRHMRKLEKECDDLKNEVLAANLRWSKMQCALNSQTKIVQYMEKELKNEETTSKTGS